MLGTALLDLSSKDERRHFDPKAAFIRSPLQLVHALTGFVRMLLAKFSAALTMAMPYLGLLAGFAAFIKWNGGIVLGMAVVSTGQFFSPPKGKRKNNNLSLS